MRSLVGINPVNICWQREEEDDPVNVAKVVLVKPTEKVALGAFLMRMLPVDIATPRRNPSSGALGMPVGHPCSDSQDECAVAGPHAVVMPPLLVESKQLPPLWLWPGVGCSDGAVSRLALPVTNGLGVTENDSQVLFCVCWSQRRREAAGLRAPMVLLIQRCLSPRGRSSARLYARWALQSSFVVLGVSPVRSLCAEAVQMDVLEASDTLAVRILTPANHTPP